MLFSFLIVDQVYYRRAGVLLTGLNHDEHLRVLGDDLYNEYGLSE
ncbi:hypothetical protein [Methylobacter psychrophilus]|nr:hypothetical protein [Methylobacter psychrophilus]